MREICCCDNEIEVGKALVFCILCEHSSLFTSFLPMRETPRGVTPKEL